MAVAATYHVLPFVVPWLTLVRTGVACAVVAMIVINLHGLTADLLGLPAAGLLYLGLLIVMRELGRSDWQRLRDMMPRPLGAR